MMMTLVSIINLPIYRYLYGYH